MGWQSGGAQQYFRRFINRSRFEPYGYVAAGTKPSANTSAIGFTGNVQDAKTDLVYMQQRYYDPLVGRFLSVDPIATDAGIVKGFGRYEYVDNNPYAKIDPDGRAPFGGCSLGAGCETVYDAGMSEPDRSPGIGKSGGCVFMCMTTFASLRLNTTLAEAIKWEKFSGPALIGSFGALNAMQMGGLLALRRCYFITRP